jgi:hypothetical protein
MGQIGDFSGFVFGWRLKNEPICRDRWTTGVGWDRSGDFLGFAFGWRLEKRTHLVLRFGGEKQTGTRDGGKAHHLIPA